MKKETYLTDYLSKYTIKQLCEEEWNDAEVCAPRSHYRHKPRMKKVVRSSGRSTQSAN